MSIRNFPKYLVYIFFGAAPCLIEPGYTAELGPVPESVDVKKYEKMATPFDIPSLKSRWRQRIEVIRASGQIPIIDIESSFNPKKLDTKNFAEQMDKNGVALIAMSAQVGKSEFKEEGKVWSDAIPRLMNIDPWRYIPASTAAIYPAWTETPDEFLEKTIEKVTKDNYPLLGEFEFRHYPSPPEYKRGETYRDVTVPIDSEAGEKLFAFSEKSGLSFQIHYEVEDTLLPPLEKMLKKYPGAKVIWCHLAQVRYKGRASKYDAKYVEKLINEYPNLYFDLAFGDKDSIYPGSREYHARVWDRNTGKVKQEWVDLIQAHPWRFMAAFDLGGDRMNDLPEKAKDMRYFLSNLPEPVREIVAYKAAWKLLFNEEI